MDVQSSIMFHQAIAVSDLPAARAFYGELLGCEAAKATDRRVNYAFFGHHLVVHQVDAETAERGRIAVEGRRVNWRHFGVLMDWSEWEALAARLTARGASFLVAPHTRHAGEPNEEALMFLLDPSGNGVEFKTFRDLRYAFEDA